MTNQPQGNFDKDFEELMMNRFYFANVFNPEIE